MKILLPILLCLFLTSGKLAAQEVKTQTLPKGVTAQNKAQSKSQSLEGAHNFLRDFKLNCVQCDLAKAKYFATIQGISYPLNSSEPLPFPKKWVKEANIMQKLSGYEVRLKLKPGKEVKAMTLLPTKVD